MEKENIQGASDKASGAIKDALGKATGNEKLQAEGKFDKAKGEVRDAVGNAKNAAKDAIDKA